MKTEQLITDVTTKVAVIELKDGMPISSKNLSLTDGTLTADEKAQIQAAFTLIKQKSK